MSRPLTRMTTAYVATSPRPASDRRWGLRPSAATPSGSVSTAADQEATEEVAPSFWETYVLAFC